MVSRVLYRFLNLILNPNLKALGIAPEDIDTVILTHGHPDHIGGNTDSEGKPTFPNARYVMWQDEWDFWTSEQAELKLDEHVREVLLQVARKNLPPIQAQLDLINHETEIVPGIQAIAAPGHTPGHMALAISSEGEQNCYASPIRRSIPSIWSSQNGMQWSILFLSKSWPPGASF